MPFDLRALRYLKYNPDQQGRSELASKLKDYVKQAASASGGLYETIQGSSERTRRIVADFTALLNDKPAFAKSLIVRIEAGLSSIAISDDELKRESAHREDRLDLLLKERDLFRQLMMDGATARVILSPPADPFVTKNKSFTYLRERYRRLIAVLEGNYTHPEDCVFKSDKCQIALAPFRGNNLLILGDQVFYEGMKIAFQRGFDLTTRITHSGSVATRVHAFDRLFEDAKAYTLRYYGHGSRNLSQAVLGGIKEAYGQFD